MFHDLTISQKETMLDAQDPYFTIFSHFALRFSFYSFLIGLKILQ